MTYAAAVSHLFALGHELAPAPGDPRRHFDLASMRALSAALGHPERATPAILIAGTNGKGSTSATLASILATAGYRVGLYTSPHLQRVNERIQLSAPVSPTEYSSTDAPGSAGEAQLTPIADEDFARLYFHVDTIAARLVANGVLAEPPSFFERLTAIALLFFAERRAEIAILEVGLGGRLDATNIVDPLISVITDIAIDHQEYLGTTIAAITREKAGILRDGGTLITLPQHPEANQTLGEVAAALARLRAISAADLVPPAPTRAPSEASGRSEAARSAAEGSHATPSADESGALDLLPRNRYTLNLDGEPLSVDSPLSGSHQQRNLALALATARDLRNTFGYELSPDAMAEGIRRTAWPGRLQSVPLPASRTTLLLDVAHNPAGAWTLREAVAALPPNRSRTLLFSCLRDKDLDAMAQILFPLFDGTTGEAERRHDHIVLAPVDNPRAAGVADLLAAAHRLDVPAHAAPHLTAALTQAIKVTPPGGVIVATGSIYLVGGVLDEIERFGLDRIELTGARSAVADELAPIIPFTKGTDQQEEQILAGSVTARTRA